MYFLNAYNEVDVNFVYKSTLNRIIFFKTFKINISKPKLRIIINFSNILEPNFVGIYSYMLFFWLVFFKTLSVNNIGQSLRRGVRYYRFILKLDIIDDFRFYRFIDFLMYDIFRFVGKKNFVFSINSFSNIVNLKISNLYGFSNIKFSNNFYLTGFKNFVNINFLKKKSNKYFNSTEFYINLFKII